MYFARFSRSGAITPPGALCVEAFMRRFILVLPSLLVVAACVDTVRGPAAVNPPTNVSAATPGVTAPAAPAASPYASQVPGAYEPAVDLAGVNLDRWQRDMLSCKRSASRQTAGVQNALDRQIAEQVAANSDTIRADVRGSSSTAAYEKTMRTCMAGRGYTVLN
jgi:hypothetical protein